LNPAPILHVEDSEDDRLFLRRAFDQAGIQNTVHTVEDGQQAIDYLSSTGAYSDRKQFALPCMVILDLKMPKMHGLDVLKWIRAHEEFKPIIVIILSSSPLRNDVDTAYKTGSNSFIVKPLTGEQMKNIARLIKEYWLETNEFPSLAGMDKPFGTLGIRPPPPFNT
jgi:two-component system response regulator